MTSRAHISTLADGRDAAMPRRGGARRRVAALMIAGRTS